MKSLTPTSITLDLGFNIIIFNFGIIKIAETELLAKQHSFLLWNYLVSIPMDFSYILDIIYFIYINALIS